jgi:hypothetical protein
MYNENIQPHYLRPEFRPQKIMTAKLDNSRQGSALIERSVFALELTER